MVISYIGNRKNKDSFGVSFNTESLIALTLEELNHTVNFIQEDEIQPNTLAGRVKGSDLFLWTRTWQDKVTMDDLKQIEALGIPTVSYHMDKYSGIQRDGGMGIGSPFWKTRFVFSPEGSIQSARIFKEHGINQYYMPPAIYSGECYIADPVDHFKHDVTFIGGGAEYQHPEWQGYRRELMSFLQRTYGNRFGKYGHPQKTVRGHELNQLCSSSSIMIGDSLCKDFMDSYYLSDRIFSQIGRGGGVTIAPYIPGTTDYFVDRKEIVLYSFGNWVQLKNLIDYYLDPNNRDEHESIRMAGFERVKRDHTFTNRMTTMLDILRQEGAIQ